MITTIKKLDAAVCSVDAAMKIMSPTIMHNSSHLKNSKNNKEDTKHFMSMMMSKLLISFRLWCDLRCGTNCFTFHHCKAFSKAQTVKDFSKAENSSATDFVANSKSNYAHFVLKVSTATV